MENKEYTHRLIKFIDHLGVTPYEFSKGLGIERADRIYNILNEKNKLTDDMAYRIKHYHPTVCLDWLIKGKGNMLEDAISESSITRIDSERKTSDKVYDVQSVPLYDSNATLGLTEVFNGVESGNMLSYLTIPNLPKTDGAIFMTGDSMYPLLKSGDIVCLRMIDINDLRKGEMYYVEYFGHNFDSEFKVIKFVTKSSKGDDFVCLVSHNVHHAPTDISIAHIKTIAIVTATVSIKSL